MPSRKPKSKSAKNPKRKKGPSKKSSKSTTKRINPASSYEAWLSQQVKERQKHPSSESRPQGSEMPADTFETWLKNQPVVEKQSRGTVTAPTNTFEEWIRKQVAEKQSEPDEEREVESNTERVSEQQVTEST